VVINLLIGILVRNQPDAIYSDTSSKQNPLHPVLKAIKFSLSLQSLPCQGQAWMIWIILALSDNFD
jgi:hypothetical protein